LKFSIAEEVCCLAPARMLLTKDFKNVVVASCLFLRCSSTCLLISALLIGSSSLLI
jgi:hypothetical protein